MDADSPGPELTWAELRLKRVTPRDRLLVEWVANSTVGDRIPEPWGWARSPTQSVIITLVTLGVIPNPPPGADPAVVAREAAGAARDWLERHPQAGGADLPVEPGQPT